jgi:predicted nucleotidyltransferase
MRWAVISLKSEVTRVLLNYFFINPDQGLFVNEIARNLGLDKRNLVKKLKELEERGLMESQKKGTLKIYSINKAYPLYDEYKKIILKTVGVERELKEAFNKIKNIKEAYIFGSYSKDEMDTNSDIDVLTIGEHSIIELQREINKIQKVIGREINVINMSSKEYKDRVKRKEPFIQEILKQKNIRII